MGGTCLVVKFSQWNYKAISLHWDAESRVLEQFDFYYQMQAFLFSCDDWNIDVLFGQVLELRNEWSLCNLNIDTETLFKQYSGLAVVFAILS